MKTIHKRLYTTIPRSLAAAPSSSAPAPTSRVRSNSAGSSRSLYTASSSTLPFSFFDAPAPPPSRPGSSNLVISPRLAEAKAETEPHSNSPYSNSGQHNVPQSQSQSSGPPPYPLAFSSGQSDASRLPTSNHYNLFFPYPSFGPASTWHTATSSSPDASHPSKRQRTRYHLDVGAYGIPKKSHASRVAGREGRAAKLFPSDSSTAIGEFSVQVGEDAYFVRDNAMGVADGVGGWSKVRHSALDTHRPSTSGRSDDPTPSALFARRLMHYCCEEVDAATPRPGMPESRCAPIVPSPNCIPNSRPATISAGSTGEREALHDQLADSLEDLADGLDVLMILEKAFDKTIKAHVVPQLGGSPANPISSFCHGSPEAPSGSVQSQDTCTSADAPSTSLSPRNNDLSHARRREGARAHTEHASPNTTTAAAKEAHASPQASTVPLMEGSSTALLAILEHPPLPSPKVSKPRPLFSPHPRHAEAARAPAAGAADRGAVIRIAHLGDCMAMLIRGEEIVWRTEEMWWNFNTPVQLGPSSSTKPHDAQIYTVPVTADDILILASDGLSDNLWDEDILDEVVRFRRSFLPSPSPSSAPTGESMALRRSSLAGMLSEALCSRARCVSERGRKAKESASVEDDIPFGRRAREMGRPFHGGKPDDISVLVAVVSPVESQ
ncbi:hypothetical protein EIP86_001070 [Pleurotus ostreatoroseus]|nr:hypothetical protein EIP86_001070 [Pleurotus ostreatoroseus]